MLEMSMFEMWEKMILANNLETKDTSAMYNPTTPVIESVTSIRFQNRTILDQTYIRHVQSSPETGSRNTLLNAQIGNQA